MKIFKEGTTYERIEKKYTQKGKERILKLLIEDIGGKKPRVTKHKKIFNRIIEVIQSMIRSNEWLEWMKIYIFVVQDCGIEKKYIYE